MILKLRILESIIGRSKDLYVRDFPRLFNHYTIDVTKLMNQIVTVYV